MGKKVNMSKVKLKTYIIPHHILQRLNLFSSIARIEMNNSCVNGNMRTEAKRVLVELKQVAVPDKPQGISKKERQRIERAALQIVRNNYRPKPEYYKVPSFIRKNKKHIKYFHERLQMEINLREGYKCRQG